MAMAEASRILHQTTLIPTFPPNPSLKTHSHHYLPSPSISKRSAFFHRVRCSVSTADSEWSSRKVGEVMKQYNVPDWPLLATYLVSEAGLKSSSRWSNYISALPSQPYSLLYWTRSELDRYLETSEIRQHAIERINDVTGTYNDLIDKIFSKYPDLFPEEVFNIDSFKWSFGILFSRLVSSLYLLLSFKKKAKGEQKNMITTSSNIVSCNFSPLPSKSHSSLSTSSSSSFSPSKSPILLLFKTISSPKFFKLFFNHRKGQLQLCCSSSNTQTPQDPSLISSSSEEEDKQLPGDGGGGGEERDWTTSFLLFVFWAGLMYYVSFLAPNQTPVTDVYFLKKLLNLKGDDGFVMNQVLVAEWYIMGLWPLVYSMLLIPTGSSSKSKIPVWPFVLLSFVGGAYALIPYFVLWNPPPPPVEESELGRWPLNFLESKLTAGITMIAGLAIVVYAFSSGGDVWKEFYQYFQGSKFIHIMSIDFALLSTFAPFWVYNDLTARKWSGKGTWLLPLSVIPFLGPAIYLLFRPSLSVASTASTLKSD